MKILEVLVYMKLPEDFKGDSIDALQLLTNYARSKKGEGEYQDVIDMGKMSVDDLFLKLWDNLVDSDNTRSGYIRTLDNSGGKWKEIDSQ